MNPREMVAACNKYVDSSMCELICAKDGVEASTTNVFQLNLMLNTWIGLGIDMQFPGWEPSIIGLLHTKGLTGTVKACDEAFLALMRGDRHGGELFSDACNYLQGVPSTDAVLVDRIGNVSKLFRFAKRFTYETDTANAACFEKFIEANRSCYSSSDNRAKPVFNYSGKRTVVTNEHVLGRLTPTQVQIIGEPTHRAPIWYHDVWNQYLSCKAEKYGFKMPSAFEFHTITEYEKFEKAERREPLESEGGPIKRPGYTLIMKVKELVTDMIGREPVVPLETFDGILSSGSAVGMFRKNGQVVQESVRLRSDKLDALYSFDPRYNHCNEGYFIVKGVTSDKSFRSNVLKLELEGSKMIAVPKSLTDRRLIKPEPVHRGFYASKVRKLLETQLIYTGGYEYLRWDDQSINRGLARLGSAQIGYSTIDASAASDRQSRELTFMLVPEWIRPLLYNSITDYVVVDGKRIRVRCFSTSGNQLTWFMLGIIMRSIAEYGCSWYTDDEGNQLHASAYGDDLVVPDVAYESVVQLLEDFGFVINRDKSYTASELFRESCGGDYFAGFDVTPDYWRRGIVDINDYVDTVAFVCNLQHKLYSYPSVRYYLRYIAYKLDPKITASPIGADCDDLWDGNISTEESELLPHRKLKVTVKSEVKYSQTLMDHQYFSFLKNGRAFGSDVDRRYGISLPYLSPNLVTEPTQRWVLVNPPYFQSKKDK